jgi:predicted ATPase
MNKTKHVITGGPGIGKSTVINLLTDLGYKTVPESARYVIEREQRLGTRMLPWLDLSSFQRLVMDKQLEMECVLPQKVAVFLDRGLADGLGYCAKAGIEPPPRLVELSQRRYGKIFLLDPLPSYENDAVRLEDAEEAKVIHQSISEVYQSLGYELIKVPVLPPDERVEYILARI